MALPLYLAMTAAEIQENSSPVHRLAYMACHFSSYGTGLSNLPKSLPKNSMLILNDRTPIHGHDPMQIREQLEEIVARFQCACVLLDFQRMGCKETENLVQLLTALPCPVGVSEAYAEGTSCPVFLPPAPLDVPLREYLQSWGDREIWLEAALDGLDITVTSAGYASNLLPYPEIIEGFSDRDLHCHYSITEGPDFAKFTLYRTPEDLHSLMEEAESLGVSQSVGLWQELSH